MRLLLAMFIFITADIANTKVYQLQTLCGPRRLLAATHCFAHHAGAGCNLQHTVFHHTAHIMRAQEAIYSHTVFHHSAFTMQAQEATYILKSMQFPVYNAKCIYTIAASGWVSSATDGFLETKQAQTVFK